MVYSAAKQSTLVISQAMISQVDIVLHIHNDKYICMNKIVLTFSHKEVNHAMKTLRCMLLELLMH